MAAPGKYPDELRERAVRLVRDVKAEGTGTSACRRIGERLGINAETLRGWVARAGIDEGQRAGTTTADGARVGELERENRELERANHILRAASVFFAAEPGRPSGR